MPANITDVSTFTDPATRPAGSDVRDSASVQAPFQAAANRTRWLKNRLASVVPESGGDADEILYPSAKTRYRVYGVSGFVPFTPADWGRGQLGSVLALTNNAHGILYLDHLPFGAEVVQVDVMVLESIVRATPADRWQASLYRIDDDYAAVTAGFTQISTTINPVSGTALKLMSWAGLSVTITEGRDLALDIEAPNGSLGVTDALFGARVRFHDPAPRNY